MRSFTNLVWKPFGTAEFHCSMTFFEFFSLRNFQGLLSIVQLSRSSVLSRDSFDILSNSLSLVKDFFSFFRSPQRVSLNIVPLTLALCQLFFLTFSNSFLFLLSATISGTFSPVSPTIPPALFLPPGSAARPALPVLWGQIKTTGCFQ